jgi:hypothetical protein
MRPFIPGILIFISAGFLSAQGDIRKVDFKNFTYPLSGPLLGHSAMSWLGSPKNGYSQRKPIHLVNGEELSKDSSFVMDGKEYVQYSGFTLKSVMYARLTGDGGEDAIVVLTYYTGGTQTTNYVYIYSPGAGEPKLLDFCYTGDRAYSGLYDVRAENGVLVFDLLDPRKASGDCCSSGFVETRYRWDGSRFIRVGPVTRGAVK